MWGPGLAEWDAVTFFALLPVSWLPEDKTTRNFRIFSSWFQYFPSVIYNSRESKMGVGIKMFGKYNNKTEKFCLAVSIASPWQRAVDKRDGDQRWSVGHVQKDVHH